MNKIYTLLFALMAFCSCNPMEDIYDNLDAVEKPISKNFDYTMDVATDYSPFSTKSFLEFAENKADTTNMQNIASNKNFTAKASAKKYMPFFLTYKFPGLKDGSSAKITYRFYDATAKVTKDSTSQFIHNGKAWVYDESVNYTFTKADYQVVVDSVKARGLNNYVHAKGNQDYYFGANAYYGQFDTKLATRRSFDKDNLLFMKDGQKLDDTAAAKVIQDKIQEGIIAFLTGRYADALPGQDGVEVYYNITYSVRDNANVNNKVSYLCISKGKFKLASGPIEVD